MVYFILIFSLSNCRNEAEFLLVAKRDSVRRINLNDFSRVETLPLGKVRSVIAIDFNLKNNCIFWSDVNTDHIMVHYFCYLQFNLLIFAFYMYLSRQHFTVMLFCMFL